MIYNIKKAPYKKIALILSLIAIIVWAILGTGASLAWFTDTSPEINNIFHFAEFNLDVFYQTPDGSWKEIDGQTDIFNKNALYEPGYIQIVNLRIDNTGTVEFGYNAAVNVNGFTLASNVFGQQFNLQDYLKFGIVTYKNKNDMENNYPDRETANKIANKKLNNYFKSENEILGAGESAYLSLIVRMPEDVGNVANYRGNTQPTVELGIIVTAEQIKNTP